jgi:5-methyltetrahydropteroyltriglutamate--homocysteine methyltransferase
VVVSNVPHPTLLPTTLVGSYPQPEWLIDRKALSGRMPPRTRLLELWRVNAEFLREAQDDAALLAIRDQERAGIDIVTDGEVRRESYSNQFANALDGIDLDNPGSKLSRTGTKVSVPRVVGKIQRRTPVNVCEAHFLRSNTERRIKVTVPGPFTMTHLSQNDFYASDAELAMDYAVAVNAEIKDLFLEGVDVVQIDEPYLQAYPDHARDYAIPALNRALQGVTGTTALHTCFGYAALVQGRPAGYSFLEELNGCGISQVSIETAQVNLDCSILAGLREKSVILGVLDLSKNDAESAEVVAERIRRALPYVSAERLIIAPDCGMKYMPRAAAFAKLEAMVAGTKIVRDELAG